MRKWSRLLLISIASLACGCASCVPGVCGCALSIFPSSWEEAITYPALVLDLFGLLGIAISVAALLVGALRRNVT